MRNKLLEKQDNPYSVSQHNELLRILPGLPVCTRSPLCYANHGGCYPHLQKQQLDRLECCKETRVRTLLGTVSHHSLVPHKSAFWSLFLPHKLHYSCSRPRRNSKSRQLGEVPNRASLLFSLCPSLYPSLLSQRPQYPWRSKNSDIGDCCNPPFLLSLQHNPLLHTEVCYRIEF